MSKVFSVEIVTPVEKKFEGEVEEIILPGIEGEMAVLAGHAPLLTMLSPGVTVAIKGDNRTSMSTGEGFATINENKVVCLVDFALGVDELDFAALSKELEETITALGNAPSDPILRHKKSLIQAKLKVQGYGE